MELNRISAYISAYIMAPLLCRFGLYDKPRKSDDEGNKLERDAKQIPRMQISSPRKVQYKSKTVSRTGGTRGRRG